MSRERVLQQHPHSPGRDESTIAVDSDELDTLVAELNDRSDLTVDDVRVLAYAYYVGIAPEKTWNILARMDRPRLLGDELQRHRIVDHGDVDDVVTALSRGATILDIVRASGDAEVGWAYAVLSMIAESDFETLTRIAGSDLDPSHLIERFSFAAFVPADHHIALLSAFLQSRAEFSLLTAAQLLEEWSIDFVTAEHAKAPPLSALVAAASPTGVAVFAIYLDGILRWARNASIGEVQRQRLQELAGEVTAIGKRLLTTGSDIVEVTHRVGARRELQVLAFISQWGEDVDFAEDALSELRARALTLFRTEFASSMKLREDTVLRDAFLPDWVVDPLIQLLGPIGIDPEEFRSLFNGLAADRLSRMTAYGAWLHDRPRSIALLIVGGVVAHRRGDEVLLTAVREAASVAGSQPSGHRAVLDDEGARRLNELLGFPIPAA